MNQIKIDAAMMKVPALIMYNLARSYICNQVAFNVGK